uniref:Uncharacterized protein n=1 Tax=Auxenochlorella protothecoides TaxID=3075 RepID=A0A1D1ZR89_AUXPR
MLGPGGRPRRMVSLGKVSAPKPVNLPSQRKENNGNDPSIDLVRKSANGGWGAASGATESPTASSCSEQQAANLTSEPRSANGEGIPSAVAPSRVIPAGPTPAWGGLGMPEERKRAMEQASREQFPTLGLDVRGPHGPHSSMGWEGDERGYVAPPGDEDGGHRGYRRGYGPGPGPDGPGYREAPHGRDWYRGGEGYAHSMRPPHLNEDALPRCSGGVRERRLESQDFRRTEEYVEQYVPPPPPPPRVPQPMHPRGGEAFPPSFHQQPTAGAATAGRGPGPNAPSHGVVVPPPPPPAAPRPDRTTSGESGLSHDTSDGTAASSRRATVASSLPRSDLSAGVGGGLGEVSSRDLGPQSIGGQGVTSPRQLPRGSPPRAPQPAPPPPRILKRPDSPTRRPGEAAAGPAGAQLPAAAGPPLAAPGAREVPRPAPGPQASSPARQQLPSQASFLHHISSPAAAPALAAAGPGGADALLHPFPGGPLQAGGHPPHPLLGPGAPPMVVLTPAQAASLAAFQRQAALAAAAAQRSGAAPGGGDAGGGSGAGPPFRGQPGLPHIWHQGPPLGAPGALPQPLMTFGAGAAPRGASLAQEVQEQVEAGAEDGALLFGQQAIREAEAAAAAARPDRRSAAGPAPTPAEAQSAFMRARAQEKARKLAAGGPRSKEGVEARAAGGEGQGGNATANGKQRRDNGHRRQAAAEGANGGPHARTAPAKAAGAGAAQGPGMLQAGKGARRVVELRRPVAVQPAKPAGGNEVATQDGAAARPAAPKESAGRGRGGARRKASGGKPGAATAGGEGTPAPPATPAPREAEPESARREGGPAQAARGKRRPAPPKAAAEAGRPEAGGVDSEGAAPGAGQPKPKKAGSRSQRRNRPAKAGAGEIAGAAVPADRGPADSPTPGP